MFTRSREAATSNYIKIRNNWQDQSHQFLPSFYIKKKGEGEKKGRKKHDEYVMV